MRVEVDQTIFEIVLDGNNLIYKFACENESVSEIKEIVQDQEIHQVIKELPHNIPHKNFSLWLKAHRALKTVAGEKALHLENPKRDQMICRCQGYAFSDLEKILNSESITIKELMKKTNCGLICTACRPELSDFYSLMERKYQLIAGKTYQEWINLINQALDGFSQYSGIQLSSKDLKLTELDFPKLKFQTKTVEQEDEVKKHLANYLSRTLLQPIEVDLTILS